MADYQHILFAADLTDDTLRVGERAASVARRYGARLSLLHVVRERDVGGGYESLAPMAGTAEEHLVGEARAALDALVERLGVPVTEKRVVASTAVGEQIRRMAEELGADLVVVGSHERHGLALLRGSTTDRVLHHAPCDVLAVQLRP